MASWIVAQMPPHQVYVEPFGGAGSVLLAKPRSRAEIFNDLHSEIVLLFTLLRDPPQAARLQHALALTPFARDEFELSYQPTEEPIEQIRRFVMRSFMGFGATGAAMDRRTCFRANSNTQRRGAARDWASYADTLPAFTRRLRGVVIENRDAIACMAQHDSPQTLHYVDPPYLPATRQRSRRANGYRHELTAGQHTDLLLELRRMQGMVALSAYPSPIYDELLPGWGKHERRALADGARPRTEVLWLNPQAVAARQLSLALA